MWLNASTLLLVYASNLTTPGLPESTESLNRCDAEETNFLQWWYITRFPSGERIS